MRTEPSARSPVRIEGVEPVRTGTSGEAGGIRLMVVVAVTAAEACTRGGSTGTDRPVKGGRGAEGVGGGGEGGGGCRDTNEGIITPSGAEPHAGVTSSRSSRSLSWGSLRTGGAAGSPRETGA
ncbi:hypothetical protein [Archangium lansingense]|uniref:Uncharacterized protein n=1 Tax=Archangium lansingense TaxID=2995310 RepID=A0ABT4AEZ7_9BACT|nr:hypothetical protein [Archangium lansinium]MCY1080265.1 hypothetical protein [Archangium lansinium]